MSWQVLADRLEISDLLVAYAHAIDRRQWDALDEIFLPDAVIDYREMGGIRATLPETKDFLAASMGVFARTQHLVAASKVTLDGDTATAVTMCHNPMVLAEVVPQRLMTCTLWYHDALVRTADGWRIAARTAERLAIEHS
jgi:hypothetical protein